MLEDLGDLELDVAAEMAEQERRLKQLLTGVRSVALLGASDNPHRPARKVVEFLAGQQLAVYPVSAEIVSVGGVPTVRSLEDLPEPVDVVVVFCGPADAAAMAGDAAAHAVRAVWFQDGVRSEEAAAAVGAAGREVVMDRCVMREYRQLVLGEPRRTFFMV